MYRHRGSGTRYACTYVDSCGRMNELIQDGDSGLKAEEHGAIKATQIGGVV